MIVVLIDHPAGGVYGPWEPADDGIHPDDIGAFLRRWREAHPGAEPDNVTAYIVQSPGSVTPEQTMAEHPSTTVDG